MAIDKLKSRYDLSSKVGLVKEEAVEVLETRSFKAAVDADWRLSREWGITAVHTFVINGERIVGADFVKGYGFISYSPFSAWTYFSQIRLYCSRSGTALMSMISLKYARCSCLAWWLP